MKKVFIFDLDDTLLKCQKNYCITISRYVCSIVNHFGSQVPHPEEITRRQTLKDQMLIKEEGYTKDRFPNSLVSTYRYFHDKFIGDKNYDKNYEKELLHLGYSVFDIIPREIPYAINVLNELSVRGHDIYLLTAGEYEPQSYKIYSTRIIDYIKEENIFINETKGKEEYLKVIDKIKKTNPKISNKDIIMVGDSLKNDIEPSSSLGLTAIHVDVATWSHNDVDVKNKYITIKNMEELYLMIMNNKFD